MKRRGTFGSSYATGSGLLGWRGLGAIGAEVQSTLAQNAEHLFQYLDVLGSRINDAAASGLPDDVLAAMRTERETLRASLARLSDRVSALQTQDDVRVWESAYLELRAQAGELDRQIVGAIGEQHESRAWSIGIWSGVAVLGTVGAVLLVRWYGSRRRRR